MTTVHTNALVIESEMMGRGGVKIVRNRVTSLMVEPFFILKYDTELFVLNRKLCLSRILSENVFFLKFVSFPISSFELSYSQVF